MLKIAMLGIGAVLTALFLKDTKPVFPVLVSMTACVLILFYGMQKLSYLGDMVTELRGYVGLKDSYAASLLKMVGITYVADFSASLCRDAGYSAVAGQIEFFGKLSVLTISAPVVLALLETISSFLT